MKKFVPKAGLDVPHPAGGWVAADGVLVADHEVGYFVRRAADGDGELVDWADQGEPVDQLKSSKKTKEKGSDE